MIQILIPIVEIQHPKRTKIGFEADKGLLNMCKFCDYSADDISDLKIHMKIHENVLPIALLIPKISQTNIINKIRSERKHHEMLRCPKENCNFETPYYKKLQAHLKCKYTSVPNKHSCMFIVFVNFSRGAALFWRVCLLDF